MIDAADLAKINQCKLDQGKDEEHSLM